MKNILILFFLFINSINMIYSQKKIIDGGELKKITIKGYDSVDFFIVPNNARLFNASKGKFRSIGFYKLTFDEKNNRIINVISNPFWKENSKHIKIAKCQPLKEDGNSQKYSMSDIKKCFDILIKDISINWNDNDGCDERAQIGYMILKKNKFYTLKAIAIPDTLNLKNCYSDNKTVRIKAMWMYHVANVISCDDNNYYVLDPRINNLRPLLFNEWSKAITFKEIDCEKFELFKGNSGVKIIEYKSDSFMPRIVDYCD